MKPQVSIIVPVYNVEKYLKKCLDSLVKQTLKEIEIIVINDGSPDNSQEIIDKYAKKYPNIIKSFIKENGGLGSARNYGLTKATGSYILFVDSDDFIDKNMVELLYKEAKKSDSDIVVCGNKLYDEEYKCLKEETPYCSKDKNNITYNFLFGKVVVWNKLYKKSLIIKNNLKFRSKVWYEDIDFNFKCFTQTNKISFIENSLYNYLLRDGSIMNNSNLKRNLELIDSFNEIINYCKEKKVLEEYYSELEFLCIYHMYICGITRVINTNNKMKDIKEVINEFISYINNNFTNFKNNKYIKTLSISKRIVYTLLNLKQYYLIKILFKIKNKVKN